MSPRPAAKILITGMSGTGKSTALRALDARGHRTAGRAVVGRDPVRRGEGRPGSRFAAQDRGLTLTHVRALSR